MPRSKIRNRIKAHRRVRAGDLVPHEMNFRRHPAAQKAAMRGMYDAVGFARSLLVYELPDGRLKLIDGHLRRELTPDMEVDVEVLDVTEEEAQLLLGVLDPLASLAESDATTLANLLGEIRTAPAAESSKGLQELFDSLTPAPAFDLPTAPESIRDNIAQMQQMRKERRGDVQEKHDTERYLIVVFASRQDKEARLRALGLPSDERYLPADSYELRATGPTAKPFRAAPSSAPKTKSGATG